ncbi:MAG TPA: hypothetical protein VN285_00360 [Candidatus Deferrimicrobium sp.]|nr:hypothetical protein [Candidatus Deferrimicrobium sp.]
MSCRNVFLVAGMGFAAGLTSFSAGAARTVSVYDTISFVGITASPSEPMKCVDLYVVNSMTLGGLLARIRYDPAVLTPVLSHQPWYADELRHDTIGRALPYDGSIVVRQIEPGALKIVFLPLIGVDARLPVGAGPVVRVYFNLLPGAPLGGSLLTPIDAGYDINRFSTPQGFMVVPTLVAASVDVAALPYQPGDVDGSGFIEIPDPIYLGEYMFLSGPAPQPPNSGDVNSDCSINIADVVALVEHVLLSGQPPRPGCVQCRY